VKSCGTYWLLQYVMLNFVVRHSPSIILTYLWQATALSSHQQWLLMAAAPLAVATSTPRLPHVEHPPTSSVEDDAQRNAEPVHR